MLQYKSSSSFAPCFLWPASRSASRLIFKSSNNEGTATTLFNLGIDSELAFDLLKIQGGWGEQGHDTHGLAAKAEGERKKLITTQGS